MFGKRKAPPPRTEWPPVKRCSFCNKSARDVERLISGPHVFICSECVAICQDILKQNRILDSGKTPEEVERDRQLAESGAAVLCGLCDVLTDLGAMVQVPARGWVCKKCVAAIRSLGPHSVS